MAGAPLRTPRRQDAPLVPASLLRWSTLSRLGVAAALCVALWGVVVWATATP
ncbi:hypothetical protein WAE61_18115 [Comamonadaceae bacterium PP-2]